MANLESLGAAREMQTDEPDNHHEFPERLGKPVRDEWHGIDLFIIKDWLAKRDGNR